MSFFNNYQQNCNVQIGPVLIENVATKVGSLFGEKGRRIGEKIDEKTKDITIKIPASTPKPKTY